MPPNSPHSAGEWASSVTIISSFGGKHARRSPTAEPVPDRKHAVTSGAAEPTFCWHVSRALIVDRCGGPRHGDRRGYGARQKQDTAATPIASFRRTPGRDRWRDT